MVLNNKRFTNTVLYSLAILFMLVIAPKEFSAATITYLTDMEPAETVGNFAGDTLDQPFEDLTGTMVTGIRLKAMSDNSRAVAKYHIEDLNYTTFDTQITLDKTWSIGDYGKTAVGIYADDYQLLEKQVTITSGKIDVHLALPSDAKNLTLVVGQLSGTRGNHGVIFKDARLSTGGSTVTNKDEVTKLETIGMRGSDDIEISPDHIDINKWRLQDGCCSTKFEPFQDIKGNIITSGIGMYEDDGTAIAQFNIDQMGYNIFETKVTVDSKWIMGDYGKSAVAVFADDYKLYEKQMTASTPVQSIRVKIPKGTKNLYLVSKHLSGARGEQKVIFIHPIVKKTNEAPLVVVRHANVNSVGAIDYSEDIEKDEWYNAPFQYVNGNIVTSGIGLDYDGEEATYDISGMNFNTFTANLSLDSKWIIGDYGSTSIYFYANNRLIYSQSVTKATGIKPLFLHLPSGTTIFKIRIAQKEGTLGNQRVVLGDAQFKYYSYTPNLSATQLKATNNSGKKDVVTISKVVKGDVIKIYNSAGKLLAAPVATGSTVTVYLPQIGPKSGKLYIAAKRGTSLDSARTAVSFGGEKTSTSKLKKVSIKNNKKTSDTITVSGLQKYDTVYVYNSRGTMIAYKTASSSTATIYIKQLGTKSSSVYLAVKGSGMTTSSKVKVTFKSE